MSVFRVIAGTDNCQPNPNGPLPTPFAGVCQEVGNSYTFFCGSGTIDVCAMP